jgi:hypothetical protein
MPHWETGAWVIPVPGYVLVANVHVRYVQCAIPGIMQPQLAWAFAADIGGGKYASISSDVRSF